MSKMNHPQGGFTLSETLFCIGIVSLIAGLSSAVWLEARTRSAVAYNLSVMRQLGQAAAIYSETTDSWPSGTFDLVTYGLVPSTLCQAKGDATKAGIGNEVVKELSRGSGGYAGLITPFVNSFVGVREFGHSSRESLSKLSGGANIGWLVDLTESEAPEGLRHVPSFVGVYRRLCLDGSVIVRRTQTISTIDPRTGSKINVANYLTLFGDGGQEWLEKLRSN